jgi:death-on-curing protein
VTTYLDLDTVLRVAERAIDSQPLVADYGLLESALGRPAASVFGQDAYPTLEMKAAALLHSIAKNHCLVDGNNCLAWLAMTVFCYINGVYVNAPDDEAYEFMLAVADGTLAEVDKIAQQIALWSVLV